MPILAQPVTELTHHVFFPIIKQLINRLLVSFNLDSVIEDKIYINSDWSTHSRTSDLNNNVDTLHNRLIVNASPQLNPTSQKWDMYTFHHTTAYGIDTRTFNNQVPIYADSKHQVRLVEMRSPITLNLSCELRLTSAELAYQTPQQIFNDFENGSIYKFTDLFYDYPVPHAILDVLYQMWKMDRQAGEKVGVDFVTYLKIRSNGGWQLHKHREKEEYEVVVPVYDLQTLTTLEYSDDKPEAIMENRLPVGYSIQFTIYSQFGMPTLNLLQYQPWFDNQLLPFECIPVDRTSRFNNLHESHCGHQDQLYSTTKYIPTGILRVPWYDDWMVPDNSMLSGTNRHPICILGILLDEEQEYTSINLNDEFSKDIKLSNVLKEALYQQGEESMEFDALYTVALFRDNKMLLPERDFTFSEDLTLKFKPVYREGHYRLVIFATNNITEIHPKWYYMIRQLYPWLPPDFKEQIKKRVEFGPWKNPDWKHLAIKLLDDGWIIDNRGNKLEHISKYEYIRSDYAGYTTSRVIKNYIIPRKTKDVKTRGPRFTPSVGWSSYNGREGSRKHPGKRSISKCR